MQVSELTTNIISSTYLAYRVGLIVSEEKTFFSILALNRQVDNFINPLKLFAHSNYNHQTFVALLTDNDRRADCPVFVNAAPSRYFLRSRPS